MAPVVLLAPLLAGCKSRAPRIDTAALAGPLAMIGAANALLGKGPASVDALLLQVVVDHAARCRSVGAAAISPSCAKVFDACEIRQVPLEREFARCKAALADLDASVASAEREGAVGLPRLAGAPDGAAADGLVRAARGFAEIHPAYERLAPLLADAAAERRALEAACDASEREYAALGTLAAPLAPYKAGLELTYLSAGARCLAAMELELMAEGRLNCRWVNDMGAAQFPASYVARYRKLRESCADSNE